MCRELKFEDIVRSICSQVYFGVENLNHKKRDKGHGHTTLRSFLNIELTLPARFTPFGQSYDIKNGKMMYI